jgi:hypothetical protein
MEKVKMLRKKTIPKITYLRVNLVILKYLG